MEEILIVDGYNLIGAWPELSRLASIRLEDARDKLIEELADYQSYSGKKVIVVFDAHQVPGPGAKLKTSRVDVRYTREKETADELIERLVGELKRRTRRIYVATSDLTEQRVTFGKGALRLSARELLIDMKACKQEMEQEIDRYQAKVRNTFSSKIPLEFRALFEKWRRGGQDDPKG
jgi:predicted RNA-binding protein with PIN domain